MFHRFPVSLSFEEFATLYRPLLEARAKEQAQAQAQQAAAGAKGKGGAAVKAAAATVPELSAKELALRYLNEQFASEDGEFQVGKNRIFLRTPAVKVLEEAKATVTTHTLSKFQALARKHLAQRRFKTMRGMAIVVQAKVRMFLKRRQFRQQIDSKVEERLRSQRMAAQRNQVRVATNVHSCGYISNCKRTLFESYNPCSRYRTDLCPLDRSIPGYQQLRAARTGPTQCLHGGGVHQS